MTSVAQNGLFGCGRLPKVRPVTVTVPPVVEHLLTAAVAVEIAEVFTDGLVYPERIVVDSPASRRPGQGRRFPGWPGPVLVLSDENQGVCSWGVPLDDGSSPVLVGGELLDVGEAPGSRQYRFEGLGVRVLLWPTAGQCDWWVSAAEEKHLRVFAAGLLDLPGLRGTLWSNDDTGASLLAELLG